MKPNKAVAVIVAVSIAAAGTSALAFGKMRGEGERGSRQVGQKAQSSFGRICLNFYDEHIRALASPLIKQPAFFAGLDQAIRGFAQRGAPCFGACGRRRGDADAGGRHEAAWRFTEAERLGHALCEQCVFTAVMAAQD